MTTYYALNAEEERPPLEGILMVLRALVAIAGGVLMFGGIYCLYPLAVAWRNIPLTTLKFYMVFFGMTLLLVEGKGILPKHHDLRRWFYSEFGFLNHPRGKGFYYILVGTLSLALARAHTLFLLSGTAITAFGIINLVISFLNRRQLKPTGLKMADFQTTTITKKKHKRSNQRPQETIVPVIDREQEFFVRQQPSQMLQQPVQQPSQMLQQPVQQPSQLLQQPSHTPRQHMQTPAQFLPPPRIETPPNAWRQPNLDLLSYTEPLRFHAQFA